MSVAAFVSVPKGFDEGRGLYTPIATEEYFRENWVPIIEALNLKWINVFRVGLDLTKEDLPNVLDELNLIKVWGKENLKEDDYNFIIQRISNLEAMLDKAFQYDDVTVFIG